MIGALLSDFWPYIAGAAGAVLAFLSVYLKGRSDAKAKQAADTLKRVEAGRKGAATAKDKLAKGKTAAEIKAENDKRWNG